jgi:DNA-binding CsgD family transcriptional regulator
MALMGVAWLALLNGQYELSHAMGERAVAASRAKGDAAELALILNLHLQDEIQALADPATTRPMAAEALTLSHAAGEPARIAIAHFALGCIALQEGDQTTAEQHLQILEDITRTSDVVYLLPFALHNLGLIAWRQGNHAQALDRQCEALDLRLQQRDKRGVALSLESLGWLAGSIGQERRAVRLLAAAERTREAIGVQVLRFRRTDHDAALASARRSLSPEELAAEWQTGSAFTLDEAVAEALALRSVPPPAAQAPPTALTERELEVAFAVAEGLTNSRIAARLVISPRTVDRHLENIMRKLDIGSRAQLAAWVASRSNG